ncbi:unnamed protein product [Mytilus coruscus]|uniref:Vitellogenin domain-containing protein n=1 Tax=Mytilus coruscus TaxID=42192 RepID=A0A6J8E9W1_MYTCO|nr:unnamed protein product [Mytilus coruscus]
MDVDVFGFFAVSSFRLHYSSEVSLEIIVSSVDKPASVAIDAPNEHLYWTEHRFLGGIGRCNFDGSNIKVILKEHDVWPVTLDLENKWIYYSENRLRSIKRVRLNGTNTETVAIITKQIVAISFDIGETESRLYYMNYDTGDIMSSRTDGSNQTLILYTGSRTSNYDLVINGDYIFCTNYNEILKVQKHPGRTSQIMHTETTQIISVFVYMENGQDIKLLFSTHSCVQEIELVTGKVKFVVNVSSAVYSMAYDYKHEYLFLPEFGSGDIKRLKYPSDLSLKTIVSAADDPANVAIDTISEHLYWTERVMGGRLARCSYDGNNITIIMNEDNLWAITLDMKNRTNSISRNYDLAVYDNKIYCTNGSQILELRKHPGTTSKTIHTETSQIVSLLIFRNGIVTSKEFCSKDADCNITKTPLYNVCMGVVAVLKARHMHVIVSTNVQPWTVTLEVQRIGSIHKCGLSPYFQEEQIDTSISIANCSENIENHLASVGLKLDEITTEGHLICFRPYFICSTCKKRFFFSYAGICRKCRSVVYEQISNLHEEDINCDASEPEESSQGKNLSQTSNWSTEGMPVDLNTCNNVLSTLTKGEISPLKYKLKSSIDSVSKTSQLYVERKADEAVSAVLNAIAPGQSNILLARILKGKQKAENNQGSCENYFNEIFNSLIKLYYEADNNIVKEQLLSIMASKTTREQLLNKIPGLTKYRVDKVRMMNFQSIYNQHDQPPVKRSRMDPVKLEHALSFFFYPAFHQIVSNGTRDTKLESGEVITVPEVVRTACHSTLIDMYISYSEEKQFTPLCRATLYNILNVCSASKRRNLYGLDNITADEHSGFEVIEKLIKGIESEDIISLEKKNELFQHLKSSKEYLKGDFKLHISPNSECADHCIKWGLSDPKVPTYQSKCEHDHLIKCDRCDNISSVLNEVSKLPFGMIMQLS